MEYYSAIKRMKSYPFQQHGWTYRELIMLREIRQREKDKYLMIPLICGILKKTEHVSKTKQKQTRRKRTS